MCVHRLASSFVCDLVMEEDQGYGGDKPTAGQGSSDLGEARKPAISTASRKKGNHMQYHETLSSLICWLQVVSDDGRRVRRAQPFTERHKEELQVSSKFAMDNYGKVLVPEMETAAPSAI